MKLVSLRSQLQALIESWEGQMERLIKGGHSTSQGDTPFLADMKLRLPQLKELLGTKFCYQDVVSRSGNDRWAPRLFCNECNVEREVLAEFNNGSDEGDIWLCSECMHSAVLAIAIKNQQPNL